MDDSQQWLVAVGGLASLLLLLLLWLGFRILFLPLRLTWRFGRGLGRQIGPAQLSMLLIWTVALEPEPFVYLWGWFLRFGKAVLVDTPRQLMPLVSQIQNTCPWSESNCSTSVIAAVYQVWTTAISNPVSSFNVPSQIARAALIFAIGASIALAVAQHSSVTVPQSGRNNTRTVLALSASFLFALYLVILAIIAIPAFGEKIVDVGPHRIELDGQLEKAVAAIDSDYPDVEKLVMEREDLPNINTLTFPGQPQILDAAASLWRSQLDLWDQSATRLREATSAVVKDATNFSQKTLTFFQVRNEGHIGEMPTKRHVTVLVSSFNLWLGDHRTELDACTASLREGLSKLRTFHGTMVSISGTVPSGNTALPIDLISRVFGSLQLQRCGDLRSIDDKYLPARTGPADTLGPFGGAAAWLLQTENPELALIIGLLGFGFLGALAASFVREFADTPGNELPAIGFVLPALIRGIGAAILVFLLAKGGTAIFVRGDASPNAYAIFVACFVAAVFSEDVWSWARTRQRRQLNEGAPADGTNGSPGADKGSSGTTKGPTDTTAPTAGTTTPTATTTAPLPVEKGS